MKIGVSAFLVFVCCWKGRNRQPKIDNWDFWIWVFFVQKWPFRDAYVFFQKKSLLKPHVFIVFLGCALLGPSCLKREILGTHPKKKKILTDNWKAHFWVFYGFFFFFFFFFLFFLFWCFFLDPHLALSPPYLSFWFSFCFWGGFLSFLCL